MAKSMTIGQLAKATGVGARAIRYYESAGVLPRPARSPGGYRQYPQAEVERLLFIRRARALRLPLAQVRALIGNLENARNGAMRPRLLATVRAQLSAVQREISELEALRRQLDEILRRAPRMAATGEPCRCLDPSKASIRPTRRARPRAAPGFSCVSRGR